MKTADYNHLTHYLDVSFRPFVCVPPAWALSMDFDWSWQKINGRQNRKEKYLCAFLTKVAIHSFFFFQLAHFTWPYIPNEFLLNWPGTGNRTPNMVPVFVYRWGGEGEERLEGEKVMANDVSYYNLAFHPALALLLSLSSLWPGWAMGHFLEKHSTEQNDFKPTDGERSHFKDKDSPVNVHALSHRTCAVGQHAENIWSFYISRFMF